MEWTDVETGWLAGIMEGEGYCKWIPQGSSQGQAKFNLQMTDRDVVERVARLVEANVCTSPPKGNNKQVYRINIKGWDKVEKIVERLLPHMGQRRGKDMQLILEKAQARRDWIARGGKSAALSRPRSASGTWVLTEH
tara:strand:+ start:245 stop:655 length:411 start_codon:yes stop_codon:yes gene_type:complete